MSALPPLRPWQQRYLDEHAARPKHAVFADPRMGKTRIGMEIIARYAKYGRALVTGPLVSMTQWATFLEQAGLTPIRTWMVSHSGKMNVLSSARIAKLLKEKPNGVLLLNDDKLGPLVDDILKWKPDVFIGDETHRWRGVSTVRGRAARRVAWHTPIVRILTGTPAPNHFGNLWGQMVALDRDVWGHSYASYARRFLIRDSQYPSRVLGHTNTDELRAMLNDWATVVRREDEFGPDKFQEPIVRTVELPDDIYRLYDKLATEYVLDAPVDITTANILARIMRLRQIASGFIGSDVGEDVWLHDALLNALEADLYDFIASGERIVIFHRFRTEGKKIEELLHTRFPEAAVWTINGTNSKYGPDAAAAFNRHDGPAVCVVQTASGGVAIDLSWAVHALVYSQDFNFDQEKQAVDRIYNREQWRTVTYYRAAETVHEYIADVLAAKANVHEAVRNADRRALVFGSIRPKRKKL